jgi:hypothetical protein
MSQYEHFQFGCTVTLEHGDLGYTDEEAHDIPVDELVQELTDKVMEILDRQLAGEIKEARELTTADQTVLLDSFTEHRSRTRKRRT